MGVRQRAGCAFFQVTASFQWDGASGCRGSSTLVDAIPSHNRWSDILDFRFLVLLLTFQDRKVNIVFGTMGSMDFGCSGSMSVRIAKLQQVLVPYMGL